MAEKIIVELEVKSNKGVKEVEKLNKELKNTSTQVKETNKSLEGATSTLDGFSGGAVSKIKNFGKSVKGLTTGFKSLRVAIIGTGIGALIIALVSLRAAFTSSEEGQNKFAKIMGVIGSVTGNLVDMLANLGESIINAFTNPKQALIDFKNLIVENITNRFNAIIDTLGFLGSAFKKVFSGDFKGALEDAKSAGSSYIDSLTGVEDSINKVTEATKGLVTELKEEAKIAGQIADQRAKADKLDRKLIIERAEANRNRAELLDKAAQKELFTAKERIGFLTEAGKIEDDITAKEIKAAKLRYDSKVAENKLSKSTKEDLLEEANLKANLINLETAKLTKQKLVSSQIVGAKREEAAEIKAIEDKAIADRKAIQELEANTEEEKRILALEKEKLRFDEAILLAEEQGLSTEELERSQKESLQLMRDGFAQTDIDRAKKIAEKTKLLGLKKVADAKAVADAEAAIRQGNLNNVGAGFALLGQLAGKNKALQSAALIGESAVGIAKTVINTQAANSAAVLKYALLPGGLALAAAEKSMNNIGAGISIATNIAATAKGLSQLKGGGSAPSGVSLGGRGGGSASVPTPATPQITSLPPSFNVVGASGTSQLADAIGGQSQQPTRAYVVAGDVTTSQEMERNTITGASI
jgi:hypothetical protein